MAETTRAPMTSRVGFLSVPFSIGAKVIAFGGRNFRGSMRNERTCPLGAAKSSSSSEESSFFLSLSGLLLQRRRRSEDDRIKASASSFKCGWVSEDGMASNQKKRRRVKGVKKNKSKKKECFSF